MVQQKHTINGVVVQNPLDWQNLQLEANFDTDANEIAISSYKFTFVEDAYNVLKTQFNTGTTGGNGIFQAAIHEIELSQYNIIVKLNHVIDMLDAEWERNRVTVDSKPVGELDWINDRVDSFSFEYLKSIGAINPATDYQFMPYVISDVPDYKNAFLSTISAVFITKEISNVGAQLIKALAKLPTVLDTLAGIIDLILELVYFVILLLILVEFLLDFFAYIIQKVKYKPIMSVNRLLEIGCTFLGLNYNSTIFQSEIFADLYILPESFDQPKTQGDDRLRGFINKDEAKQNGYPRGTFGDFIRGLKIMVNGRYLSDGNTFSIEPAQDWPTSATFTIPDIENDAFTTNASEIVGNFNLSFTYDVNDKNTIQNWTGTNVDVNYNIAGLTNPRYNLIKNGRVDKIPYARGLRKTEFTQPENIAIFILNAIEPQLNIIIQIGNIASFYVNGYINLANKLINVLDGLGVKIKYEIPTIPKLTKPNLSNLIENRIGMLLLENDMVTVPKLLKIKLGSNYKNNKLAANHETVLNAKYLHDSYFAQINEQCFYKTYEGVEMTLAQFLAIKNERACKVVNSRTSIQQICKVVSAKYNTYKQTATITIKYKRQYCNSLTKTVNEPTGR